MIAVIALFNFLISVALRTFVGMVYLFWSNPSRSHYTLPPSLVAAGVEHRDASISDRPTTILIPKGANSIQYTVEPRNF